METAGGGGGASAGAAGPGVSPFRAADEPAGRRRRRRLAPPLDRSVVAGLAGTSATGSTTGAAPSAPALVAALAGVARRRRRRRDVVGPGWAGSWTAGSAAGIAWRMTLAPTSPSAHSSPSAVWTSTRQTTIAVVTGPTGGRFWVRVQRA